MTLLVSRSFKTFFFSGSAAQTGLGAMRQGASSNWGKVKKKMDIKSVPNVKKPELEFRFVETFFVIILISLDFS